MPDDPAVDRTGATRRDPAEHATAPEERTDPMIGDPVIGHATTTTGTGSTAAVATAEPEPARRRGPDPLALVVGLATLAMAVFAFVGELPDLGFVDPRWLLAGGAATVGLLLLVGNLRGRSGGRPGS